MTIKIPSEYTSRFLVFLLACLVIIIQVQIKTPPDRDHMKQVTNSNRATTRWVGKNASNFKGEFINGQKFELSEASGKKIVVLNFFATWCGPCKVEIPEFNRLVQQFQNDPVIFIGIDAGEERGLVESFIKETELALSVMIDHHREIQNQFGVAAYPTTVAIAPDGKIFFYEAGAITNADISLAPMIRSQLARTKTVGHGHH